jgi:signal transduction histidine kinase
VAERLRGERVGGVAEYMVRGSTRVVEVSATAIEYDGAPAVLGFARDVTERKAIVTRLMESEKLAAIGTLAAGVAHEVNNPLAYLLLNLEILIRQLPKLAQDPSLLPVLSARLEQARQGGERVKTIVRDLQTFTRRDDGQGGPVMLDAALDAALSIAAHELRQGISVVRRFDACPPVLGNATRYEQLFLNLILNAAHAVASVPPERRLIELELRASEPERVTVRVRDHGAGMCPDTLGRALEPFFTTKPLGAGTGLGLSICQSIVHAAGGEMTLQSEQDRGTTVVVQLPVFKHAAAARPRPPSEPAPPVRRGRLLVIDDESAITNSIAYALSDEHEVVTCGSAADALRLLRQRSDFDIVLCDLVMPDQDGPALFQQVCAELPELAPRFVFMTGGASLPHAERFLADVPNARMEKPFELSALRKLLRAKQ